MRQRKKPSVAITFVPAAIGFFLLFVVPSMPAASAGECRSTPPVVRSISEDPWGVYHIDPQHVWNRVFRSLYEMAGPEGESDPRLWPESLLQGKRHRDLIRVLDEFLASHAEKQIPDKLARALFQHDLWEIFNWSMGGRSTEAVALQKRLVKIMRAIALGQYEIGIVIDNYRYAVDTRAYAADYDPAARTRAFLPPDLWDEKGNWVLLANPAGRKPAALLHADRMGAHSHFLVFLSLPGPRENTLKFLESLREFDDKKFSTGLPAFPVGTRVALVRRMDLIDQQGYVYASPVVETVQIRVFRDPGAPPQYGGKPARGSLTDPDTGMNQDVFMFRLDRKALVRRKLTNLIPVGADDCILHVNFINSLSLRPSELMISLADAGKHGGKRVVDSCGFCHAGPGFASFNTFLSAAHNGVPTMFVGSAPKHEQDAGRHLHGERHGYLRALWWTLE